MSEQNVNTVGADEYNRFRSSLQFVLKWEGGYVNDPSDPGGETKWGISKRSYPNLDIVNLTQDQAANIYYKDFWLASKANTLDYPACCVVLDTAVNDGVGKTAQWWSMNPFDSNTFLTNRTMFYIQLVKKNPQEQKYLGGWLNRVNDLKKLIDVTSAQDALANQTQYE